MDTRSVLISGCSSGIGLATARGLRARGWRVFATARKPVDVATLAAEGFESLRLDVDSSDSIRAAVEEVLRRTDGRLYALINNAGFGLPGAVEDLPRAGLRAQFETNVLGGQELIRLLLPGFRAQHQGRIVQMSSMLGYVALAYRGAYCASKYAIEGLTDALRLELRGTNIHVAIVEPGPIAARFRDNAYAAFKTYIDKDRSAHRTQYEAMIGRLEGRHGPLPFTLPPEAVLDKVVHALEARKPKLRYPVTFPSHVFTWLRRLLPGRTLDAVLARVSGGGQR
ncbi:MAG: short-chain dehydrogenase [Candidatus Muproteobacteria bacterium RBG_16_64_10]|uniref:Short-chain dehydrogenase n=1 Tax=Candidatus Muproteobacteria bacterium RBG_16_64_10 TaxID=1817757 RepID=A0A1F6SXN1_9PROT|nr:MAG: short-chain dehydrogenase [Candidatus Muproteobacteria bacterium RBG_16_64_10]